LDPADEVSRAVLESLIHSNAQSASVEKRQDQAKRGKNRQDPAARKCNMTPTSSAATRLLLDDAA
jgi:hypothetical protein